MTAKENVSIVGYTTPGSVVLVDSTLGNYRLNSEALRHERERFLHDPGEEYPGINTYDFKVLTPFGQQLIRSFPVFWTVYAEPDSPYHFKPSKKTTGGGRISGTHGPAGGATTGGPGSSGQSGSGSSGA